MTIEEVHLTGIARYLVDTDHLDGIVILGFKGDEMFTAHAGADRISVARLASALWEGARDMKEEESA